MKPFQIMAILTATMGAGCLTTHGAEDATGVDASGVDAALSLDAATGPDAFATPDAFVLPDAFVCPDRDGDGETDARCGGLDCDDADRNISSTRTLCASPTSVTRCDGALRVETACEGTTPYCDARTNGCVADACGDLVVHANEQCDDGRDAVSFECADCVRTCRSTADCGADSVCRPFQSLDYRDTLAGCALANPGGAPMGTACAAATDCYSGYCDATEGRCTESSRGSLGECSGPHRWSNQEPFIFGGRGDSGIVGPRSVCAFECEHDSDCADGAQCGFAILRNMPVGACAAGLARGSDPIGTPCTDFENRCASGVCRYQLCTRFCRTDLDCEAGASRCVAADRTVPHNGVLEFSGPTPRPADWGTPWPRICLP